jgi:hypothetical protein
MASMLKVSSRGTSMSRVEIYTPARLVEFNRNNEQALAGLRLKRGRRRK